jgi:hypothetical protein
VGLDDLQRESRCYGRIESISPALKDAHSNGRSDPMS